MALVIRLRQQGRVNRQSYRLVVTDRRAPRDGKYVEKLGWYDPFKEGKNFVIDAERAAYWLEKGAQPSERAKALLARATPEVLKALYEKKMQAKKKAAPAKPRTKAKKA